MSPNYMLANALTKAYWGDRGARYFVPVRVCCGVVSGVFLAGLMVIFILILGGAGILVVGIFRGCDV